MQDYAKTNELKKVLSSNTDKKTTYIDELYDKNR